MGNPVETHGIVSCLTVSLAGGKSNRSYIYICIYIYIYTVPVTGTTEKNMRFFNISKKMVMIRGRKHQQQQCGNNEDVSPS